ncbi:glycosyltransferase [Desulfonema ishimotonii]|uniref:Glycosyltransferase n=1 Tax=Desulfonema ishimotonii TaxID=45657 RepID=A0A401FZ40_9BACT|nr:WecB/TagA/CpsF family glycosyltransferase [Desulfonema ishimotonii]GBC62206.1 glycosyltransferase [Desulfonema ishimotonii]
MTCENILEYPVTILAQKACIRRIISQIISGLKGRYFACANPHSLQVAEKDPVFQQALKNADMIVPDGVGMVIASKLLGGKIRSRITGTDIFLGLSSELNRMGGFSVFFLGSTEENLAKIKKKMAHDFPHIRVAGTYSPPFRPEFSDEDNRLMAEAINRARPDVLWVGMTAPKQEKWIFQNRDRLNVKFIGPIGAVFDFYTGNVRRSHPVFQKMGLEWLPRLLQQPRRLYKRMLVSAPKFLMRVIVQSFSF